MPLKQGKSREAVSQNIVTETHAIEAKGKSHEKAHEQAVAIALSVARRSGLPKRKGD